MAPMQDWSIVSAGWDALRQHTEHMKAEINKRLLDELGLRPGQRVLELGGGAGEFARQLAAAVGPTGTVVATDAASGMVELIRATTADLPNVEATRIDAAAIDQPDASFDAVAFCMGLMFLAEPVRGLREMHRVLRPDGRIAVVTWAGIEHNPWLTSVGMSGMLAGALPGPLPTEPGGPLSLGDPALLEQLAADAGFRSPEVTAIDTVFEVADSDAHIAHVTSLAPPLKVAYAAATDEQRSAWRDGLTAATTQFATAEGIRIPGRALLLAACC